MNKKLIIAALEDAKQNTIPLITGAYRDGQCYCTVGYMAKFIGIPDENIRIEDISHPTGISQLFKVADHYGMDLLDLNVLIDVSDRFFTSWDDAIAWVEAQHDA